jgi:hypothetical protein
VNLLKKDTKPCPSCGELIFKISGCPQMWCPSCHTAFNWNTLRIETGVIHNPHYFEFQRRTNGLNREHGDIPCGGRPHPRELFDFVRKHEKFTLPEGTFLFELYNTVAHTDQWMLRQQYNVPPVNNSDLRVQYLMNKIDDERFKQNIQKREKSFKKKSNIRDVLQMFVNTSDDLFRQLMVQNTYTETIDIFRNLIVYVNTSMKKISIQYGCVVPYLGATNTIMIGHSYDIN